MAVQNVVFEEVKTPPAGLEALWHRMSGPLSRYAGQQLGSAAAGEDTVQDVFSRYIESEPVFEALAQQEAWLWRSTRNAVLDILRSKRHRTTRSLDEMRDPGNTNDATTFEPEDHRPSPEQAASAREALATVQLAFRELSDDDRDILWLSEVEGLEVKELAKVYRRPAALVKVRLHRARKRLRTKLAGKGPTANG